MDASSTRRVLVNEIKNGRERPLIKASPVRSSSDMGFKGFLLERHRLDEHENIDIASRQTVIALHLSAPIKVEIRDEARFRERIFSPGDIIILPAGVPHSCRFKGDAEFMLMSLDPDLLSRATRAATEREELELRLNWGFRDPLIRETFASLGSVCEEGRVTDRVYGESLVNSLAMHLARNCRQLNGHFGTSSRGLSRRQLEQVMDFIHNTPYAAISLQAMADAAGLSPFHFSRMFKIATGTSPHQYVLRRRVDVGAEMLLSREDSIASIALELGFADQSHFTMHFKRVHGIGPAAYRRQHRR
jgi:AraC family transcriptional regulator